MKLSLLFTCVLLSIAGGPWQAIDTLQKPAKPDAGTPQEKKLAEELDAPDVAEIPTQDLRLENDEHKRYLLAGPRKQEQQPKGGFGLLVVLPGGTGSADFHPFVKRIYKNAVPEGFLVVQPVAPKWTDDQQVIWPTAKTKTKGMKFACEDFVEEVIAEVAKKNKIDRGRIFTLSWSSSGPLAYTLSTRKVAIVQGSLIAMSVFHREDLDLAAAKGRPYYILHSEEDKTCPFKLAQEARDSLIQQGALVEFATYAGGHGWHGDVFGTIRTGLDWLLAPQPRKAAKSKDDKKHMLPRQVTKTD